MYHPYKLVSKKIIKFTDISKELRCQVSRTTMENMSLMMA